MFIVILIDNNRRKLKCSPNTYINSFYRRLTVKPAFFEFYAFTRTVFYILTFYCRPPGRQNTGRIREIWQFPKQSVTHGKSSNPAGTPRYLLLIIVVNALLSYIYYIVMRSVWYYSYIYIYIHQRRTVLSVRCPVPLPRAKHEFRNPRV